jgi:hypothetical protein
MTNDKSKVQLAETVLGVPAANTRGTCVRGLSSRPPSRTGNHGGRNTFKDEDENEDEAGMVQGQ